ncbi:WAT1-related protein At5g45370 isoform X1 [Dendrobium catenatum]|uniref:WAT1-related protein n=1 Tax=Dendrobium catenatum TaxID=906689 RepID=A0A2I0W6D0_9ASPA|nr:WAT1-related protein At5g45370 isoform X1 [Dendrobium catenatum]XP_028554107.1 WAT1-related protein At5g45370 isoform X1 [Dendrobium catenatum]PKU71217.1 WAT1-related protein [Dendrobium catenatum]
MVLVKPASGGRGVAWKAHLAMVLVQVINGGYLVITKVALNAGMNQIVFCAYRNLLGLFIVAPLAYVGDRGARPPLTGRLLLSFLLLGLTGILGNQLFFILGLGYTNPTYAAAMQPSIPAFTFILASIMGVEKVNFRRKECWIKVIGTSVCISGAAVMLTYRGPALFGNGVDHAMLNEMIMGSQLEHAKQLGSNLLNYQLGTLCLIANCISMAAFLVLQAPVLVQYPATLSLTAYTYLFGTLLIVLTGLCTYRDYADWMLTKSEIVAIIYSGFLSSAVNYGLITWSNKMIGPALVALYNPLQTFMSAFLSAIFIGNPIFLGNIFGGLLIICGLYLVTWARYTESKDTTRAKSSQDLLSDPLLQEDDPSSLPIQITGGSLKENEEGIS